MTGVTSSTRKERFSLAYIHAVAAVAGYDLLETRIDVDSVDGVLLSMAGRRPQLNFQAKATSREVVSGAEVVFPLPLKNYDGLRAETVVPRILVLVVLPDQEHDWTTQSEESLVLRRCGYWMSLRGMPATQNAASVTVRLPRTQIFAVESLQALMSKAERGPEL